MRAQAALQLGLGWYRLAGMLRAIIDVVARGHAMPLAQVAIAGLAAVPAGGRSLPRIPA
jgi:hypothetical protein